MANHSKFNSHTIKAIEKIARLGATQMEIAEILGIDLSTLKRWVHCRPGVAEAMKLGKEGPDERVKRSLYERAVGYSYPAVKIMQYEGDIVTHEYVEHVPPEPKAAEYWLNNRLGAEFVSKVEHKHSGRVGLEQIVAGVAEETEAERDGE